MFDMHLEVILPVVYTTKSKEQSCFFFLPQAKSFIIPTLTLEDVSKFGTFVNGKAVKTAGGNTVTLKENDQIKFGGTPASVYRLG